MTDTALAWVAIGIAALSVGVNVLNWRLMRRSRLRVGDLIPFEDEGEFSTADPTSTPTLTVRPGTVWHEVDWAGTDPVTFRIRREGEP